QKILIARLTLRLALRTPQISRNDADELSPTVACARALAHHRSIEAIPFSWISIIGIRFEPRIGAASSIRAVPNGNGSLAGADAIPIANTKAKRPQTKRARPFVTTIHVS